MVFKPATIRANDYLAKFKTEPFSPTVISRNNFLRKYP